LSDYIYKKGSHRFDFSVFFESIFTAGMTRKLNADIKMLALNSQLSPLARHFVSTEWSLWCDDVVTVNPEVKGHENEVRGEEMQTYHMDPAFIF
jgi:hypothetical protein